MYTRTLDKKGRVTLGSRYAGKKVDIDDSNPECIMIKPVVTIPEHEAWLYKNPIALDLVRRGLEDVRNRNFGEAPDIDADLAWLKDVNES